MSFFKNRRDDTCTFVCDDCGVEHQIDGTDFFDALDAAKDDGWRARQESGDWVHLCPDCL